MPAAARRIDSRLHAALARIDDGSLPLAEITRRLGSVADWLEIPRLSHEHVRRLVHAQRGAYPTAGDILLQVAANQRPPGGSWSISSASDRQPAPPRDPS